MIIVVFLFLHTLKKTPNQTGLKVTQSKKHLHTEDNEIQHAKRKTPQKQQLDVASTKGKQLLFYS